MVVVDHYKRMAGGRDCSRHPRSWRIVDLAGGIADLVVLILLLMVVGLGIGAVFPITTVGMQNAVTRGIWASRPAR